MVSGSKTYTLVILELVVEIDGYELWLLNEFATFGLGSATILSLTEGDGRLWFKL